MRSVIVGVFLVSIALALFWDGPDPRLPPGVLVPWEPDQELVERPLTWDYRGTQIAALARFRVRGRVLFTTRYWWGREADFSPIDLTLGWRPMSDQSVLDALRLYHSHRSSSFLSKDGHFPLSWEDLNSHAANMHMVPATDQVATQLGAIARGDLVDLHGYLIEAVGKDGWRWKSSLTRTDTGNGACELVWVEGIGKM